MNELMILGVIAIVIGGIKCLLNGGYGTNVAEMSSKAKLGLLLFAGGINAEIVGIVAEIHDLLILM